MNRRTPASLLAMHHRLEAVVVDRPAQLRIELEARVVRDAGQVNDAVDTADGRWRRPGVSRMSPRMTSSSGCGGQTLRPEEHQVVHDDRVPGGEQLGTSTHPT